MELAMLALKPPASHPPMAESTESSQEKGTLSSMDMRSTPGGLDPVSYGSATSPTSKLIPVPSHETYFQPLVDAMELQLSAVKGLNTSVSRS